MTVARTKIVSILCMFMVGIALFTTYVKLMYVFEAELLHPIFFWLGIILTSTSIVFLWTRVKAQSYLLISLFVLAYAISSIPFLRFYFHGTDLLGEYFTAEKTRNLYKWPIEYSFSRGATGWEYFTCLSVTVLPAMISHITGMPTIMVFRLFVPMFSAVVSLAVFLVIREVFGEKVAGLSAILFVSQDNYLSMFPQLLRQDVAYVFFFLYLFSLFLKRRKMRWEYSVLALINVFAIATAHYTVMYFTTVAVFILTLSGIIRKIPFIFNKKAIFYGKANIFSKELFLCTLVVGFGWLIFVSYVLFSVHIGYALSSLKSIMGLAPLKYHAQREFIVFSSLGVSHSIVKWITRILVVAGFFMALKVSRSTNALSFTFLGGTVLFSLLLWTVLPGISLTLPLDRLYSFGLLTFSAFIALSLIKIGKVHKKLSVLLPILIVTMIFMESTDYPIYYRSISKLTPLDYTAEPYYRVCDLSFASWIRKYTANSSTFVSDIKGEEFCRAFADREGTCVSMSQNLTNMAIVPLLQNAKGAKFVLVLTYAEGYLILLDEGRNTRAIYHFNSKELYDNVQFNRVYDCVSDRVLTWVKWPF